MYSTITGAFVDGLWVRTGGTIDTTIPVSSKASLEDAFKEFCNRTYRTYRRQLKDDVKDTQSEIARSLDRLAELYRKQRELLEVQEILSSDVSGKNWSSELARLLAVEGVATAELSRSSRHVDSNDVLTIVTESVSITYEGHIYDLGEYGLILESNRLKGYKLYIYPYPIPPTRRSTRNHPHISLEGTPCWGHLELSVAKLLGMGEIAAVASAAVALLNSYNPSGAFYSIDRWQSRPTIEQFLDDI